MHRWYDPGTGRWISEDPIGFAAGDANLYRYVGNGGTGARDPSGLVDDTGSLGKPRELQGGAAAADIAAWKALLSSAIGKHRLRKYYFTTGMPKLQAGMSAVTDKLHAFNKGGTSAIAIYDRGDSSIYYSAPTISAVSPLIAVHETIHVLNHEAGRYAIRTQLDEAEAYVVQAIYTPIHQLINFDDNYRSYSPEEMASEWTDKVWNMATPVSVPRTLLNTSIQWRHLGTRIGLMNDSRLATNEDFLRVNELFGLRMSCRAMASEYEKAYERWTGKKCSLKCPSDLPKAFQ
jgi:hypothetical protein